MKRILSTALASLLLFALCHAAEASAGRALSLRSLQEAVETCQTSYGCTQDEMYMHGITRFTGYLVDRENNDIILLGETAYAAPPLHLDDFVVALRNSWMRYASEENGVPLYTNPVCSIDPTPEVVQRLSNMDLAALQAENGQKEWQQICGAMQTVNVWGIPFYTHFAQVMVKADYDMKRLVDGSDVLDIPGFSSLTDITLEEARHDIMAGKPLTVSISMNRFWFAPGKNLYLENNDVVTIKECQVKLMTEKQYFDRFGEKQATGKSDPHADSFAEAFTAYFAKIARQRSINLELENLFRFVALAKILRYRQAFRTADFSPAYFLDQYETEPAAVERQLPGRSVVRHHQLKEEIEGGTRTHQLWFPSCGGVGIEIQLSNINFLSDASGILYKLRTAVLGDRPALDAIYWDFSYE